MYHVHASHVPSMLAGRRIIATPHDRLHRRNVYVIRAELQNYGNLFKFVMYLLVLDSIVVTLLVRAWFFDFAVRAADKNRIK